MIWALGPAHLTQPFADSIEGWGGHTLRLTALPTKIETLPPPERIFWLCEPTATLSYPSHPAPQPAPPGGTVAIALESTAERLVMPVVVTARGPLYAEAIGEAQGCFWQPELLTDQQRQVLYGFVGKWIGVGTSRPAPPGVYLFAFVPEAGKLRFEKLTPYPNDAALVTLAAQCPNLFECHWRAVSGLPVTDLQVRHPGAAKLLTSALTDAQREAILLVAQASVGLGGRLVQVQSTTPSAARQLLGSLLAV